MSSQPPADPGESLAGDAPEVAPPDEQADKTGSRRWTSIVIAVVAVVIAAAVAGSLLLNQTDEQPKEGAAAPTNGLACPYLQQASDAYDRGDQAGYENAVAQAKDVAEGTLQTSGQSFGTPERIALELGLGHHDDPTPMLEHALAACAEKSVPSSS